MTGLKVNFSDAEVSSEARSFEALPTGEYYCRITDNVIKESQSEKNRGKPYWALEFTVQDGPSSLMRRLRAASPGGSSSQSSGGISTMW